MCVCVRGHMCVPCAYTCLCICVRGSEAGRAGMYQCVIAVAWLHTVHRARARARVVNMFTFGVGVGGGHGKRAEIIHIKIAL